MLPVVSTMRATSSPASVGRAEVTEPVAVASPGCTVVVPRPSPDSALMVRSALADAPYQVGKTSARPSPPVWRRTSSRSFWLTITVAPAISLAAESCTSTVNRSATGIEGRPARPCDLARYLRKKSKLRLSSQAPAVSRPPDGSVLPEPPPGPPAAPVEPPLAAPMEGPPPAPPAPGEGEGDGVGPLVEGRSPDEPRESLGSALALPGLVDPPQ